MKRGLIFNLLCFLIVQFCFASTFTWNPTIGNAASNALNWLPSLNGPPGSGDDVIFNGTNTTDCNWNISAVNSISVLSGYSGMITMSTPSIILSGNLVINSGSVQSTSGDLLFAGSGAMTFSLGSSGFFDANNGTVILEVDAGQTFDFSGPIVLNVLVNEGGGQSSARSINFGTNLTVSEMVMAVGQKEHAYQGTIHIKKVLDIGGNLLATTYTTAPPNNTASFVFDGPSAMIIGVNNPNKGPLPNFVINTSGTYTLVDQINIYGNWTCNQGTLEPGNSTENFFGTQASISGTAPAFNNLKIKNGAVVSLPPNTEMKVAGDLDVNGTLNFQTTTSLGMDGPGAQSVNGTGFTLAGFKAYGSGSARSIAVNAPVNILDSLKAGNLVTINSGGNITLRSSSSLTARVAEMGTGSAIAGNITVETVIPGGNTGWSVMGIRGVSNQSVSSWDTYASSGGANGIPMTCINCFYGPSAIPNWFESIQGWDETDSFGYDTNIVAATALSPGEGFWVYIGDGPSFTNDLKLVNTGSLQTGPVSIPLTSGGPQSGFNLVANPYPSPISWASVIANSNNAQTVNDAIYAFNPDVGQTSYGAGVSNPGPGAPTGIDDVIAGGQGFYVEANSNGFLDFSENMKSPANTSANPLLRTNAFSNIGKVFRLKIQGENDWYGTTFRFHENATPGFDRKLDAKQFFSSPGYAGYPGPYEHYTTISSRDDSGLDYSIQSLPPLTASISVPILVRVSSSGSYTISANDFNEFDMCVYLKDNLDRSYHNLRAGSYVFHINDTTISPRFEVVLCRDETTGQPGIHKPDDLSNIEIGKDTQGIFVKTTFQNTTKAVISVYDVIGQKLIRDMIVEGTITHSRIPLDLNYQVVIVSVESDKELVTKKLVVD